MISDAEWNQVHLQGALQKTNALDPGRHQVMENVNRNVNVRRDAVALLPALHHRLIIPLHLLEDVTAGHRPHLHNSGPGE